MAQTHLLLLSGDHESLFLLRRRLAAMGSLRVSAVETAQEVGYLAEHDDADCLLWHLAGVDSLSRLRRVRDLGINLPALVLVGPGIHELPLDALSLGLAGLVRLEDDVSATVDAVIRQLPEICVPVEVKALRIELDRALAELDARSVTLTTLYGVGRSLALLKPMDDLAAYVVDVAAHLVSADEAALLMPNRAVPGSLDCVAMRASGEDGMSAGRRLRVEESLAAMVMQTNKLVLIGDGSQVRADGEDGRLHSLLVVPMKARSEPIGVLSVANKQTLETFGQDDALLLSALADFAAIAIVNTRTHSDSRQKAGTDVFQQTVATLSHHINNPLASMMAGVHLLANRTNGNGSDDSSPERRALAMIKDKAAEIAEVIAVLREVVVPTSTEYWKGDQMIDIDVALKRRLEALSEEAKEDAR
jgi:hypothetical protein